MLGTKVAVLGAVIVCFAFLVLVTLLWRLRHGGADFQGWHWAPLQGPSWQIAMLFFTYSAIVTDVAFVRIFIVAANLLLTAWVTFGVPTWPHAVNPSLAALHADQFVWLLASLLLVGVPMWRQFRFDDSKQKFKVPREFESVAEAMWRDWFRKSGIPRSDFKTIIEAGEFLVMPGGTEIPMSLMDDQSSSESESDDAEDYVAQEFGDVYYYIVSGQVEGQAHYEEGPIDFKLKSGRFVNDFALLTLFGHLCAGLALQKRPHTARVKINSEYTTDDPDGESSPGKHHGALLFRLSKAAISSKVLRSSGFAAESMRTVIAQAMIDELYAQALGPRHRKRYELLDQKRSELNRAPLSKAAARQTRSLWAQFRRSHVTCRDLWEPSPHQRLVNAVNTGSRETTWLDQLKQVDDAIGELRRSETGSVSVNIR